MQEALLSLARGATQPSREGPIINPAASSPMTADTPSLTATSEKKRAASNTAANIREKLCSSICSYSCGLITMTSQPTSYEDSNMFTRYGSASQR